MSATVEQARAAKAKLKERLKDRVDVVGIGIGRESASYCVKVNLGAEASGDLPQEVDGVAIRYEVVGAIRSRTAG
ncbi:MAG: hypothetical protein ACREDZ_00545 [Kiloniellales bacterium]